MFSERLKIARKRSGLSLRKLSSHMEGIVSAQAIGKYERGEMMPSSTVAIALAKTLDVSMSYLLSSSEVSLKSVEFRKLASTKARERATVEAEVLDNVERYLQVEDLLGIASNMQGDPGSAPVPIDSVEDGERAALSLRAAWNLGGGPIPDMTELLEEQGIKVFKLGYPSRLTASPATCAGQRGKMCPWWSAPPPSPSNANGSPSPTNWGTWSWKSRPACQRRKPAIASRALSWCLRKNSCGRWAPDASISAPVSLLKSSECSASAPRPWSSECVIWASLRRARLGTYSAASGKAGERMSRCPLERTESPGRFRRLCLRALAEGAISESKAAELLGLRVSEIDRIMAGSPDR